MLGLSVVYLPNRVVVMVMSSDLKFINNTDAPGGGTNGGEGVYLRTEASSLLPRRVSGLEVWH